MAFTLRDYQQTSVDKCVDYINGKSEKPGLVVVPTGGGKSLIISELVKRVKGKVLVIMPSKELLEQNYEKFILMGGEASIYSASMGQKNISHTTFGTLQSLVNAAGELSKVGFDLILTDEFHKGCPPDPGSMFMRLINKIKPKKFIGFTATPVYLKSSMEGAELKFLTRMRPAYAKEVLHCVQISELVNRGYWSKLYYQVDKFNDDILELNSNGSDFTERSIVAAVEELKVNNKIYLKIKELRASGYKRILVFMDSVANAERMHQYIPGSAVVFGKTPKKERESSINGFKDGSIDVLLNVSCLTTGFDVPEMDAIILGSATNSLALYYQMIGRGVRIHPNKDHCLIIDYLGNVNRFGVVETLEIIDYEYSGWGIFNNGILLSNTPMGGLKKTKEDLRIDFLNKEKKKSKEKLPDVILMPFGKHKGLPIESVPISYLKFILTPQPGRDEFNWNCNAFYREVKKKIDAVLARQMELTNTLRVN
jgi:DNA repair protein RadD